MIINSAPVRAGFPRPDRSPQDAPRGAETALGQIIAYFKYQSAKRFNEYRRTPGAPVRQRNYYEHIIRNESSLLRIQEYIAANPARWADDTETPEIRAVTDVGATHASLQRAGRRNP